MTLREMLKEWEVDLDEVLDTRVGGPGTTAGGPIVSAKLEYDQNAAPPVVTINLPRAKVRS